MKLNGLFHKAVAFGAAVCMTLGGLSQAAFADYVSTGDLLENWVCQVVVQNGSSEQNANLWMNDGECDAIYYKTEQHVVLDPAEGAFANAEDALNFAAIYFSYYGEYSEGAQFDITLTNVTIYSTDYDPIVLADYSSVDAGTNYPVSGNDFAIRYDFQEQLDASIRTDVLRKLDRIEFDLYVDRANFSDAPQVDGSAAPGEDYTELAVAGQDSSIDVTFYAMDGSWTWKDGGSARLVYQTDEHAVMEVDGATIFAELGDTVNTAGLQLGYYNNQIPSDAVYSISCLLTNVVLNFDGYDPIVIESMSWENAEHDSGVTHAGRLSVKDYLPADADQMDMLRHLVSVEFDYRVDYLGVTGVNMGGNESDETTQAPEETTTEPEEETTTEPEETEAPATEEAEESTAAPQTTAASTENQGSDSNTARIVVTIVAGVLLFAALIVVGVMYIKKSKQI